MCVERKPNAHLNLPTHPLHTPPQIMESLGGDQLWVDRFMAQHAAIVYYWVLVVLFVLSPKLAYNFSELIEAHAGTRRGAIVGV